MRPHLLLPLVFLLSVQLFAQSNPFLSTRPDAPAAQEERSASAPAAPRRAPGPFLAAIIRTQRTLQREISAAMAAAADGGGSKALLTITGLAFAYGFLHAMGPGHRKAVLAGYFIGEEARPLLGIAAGFLLALVHAASAIVLIGGFAWIAVQSLLLSMNRAEAILLPLSYGVIVLLGFWMLLHGIRHLRGGGEHRHGANRGGIAGILLSSVIPCPGAAAIIIFALASNALLIGILAVAAMSLGMGVLLAGVGLAAILFRGRLAAVVADEHLAARIDLILHLTAGGGMILFGLFLLTGSLFG